MSAVAFATQGACDKTPEGIGRPNYALQQDQDAGADANPIDMDAEPPPLTSCQLSGSTPGGTKWFRLEADSEPIIDDSIAQFQMLLEGEVTLGALGRCGNGVYIDDGALVLESDDDLWWSLGGGTIEMWIYRDLSVGYDLFSNFNDDASVGYELRVDGCGAVQATWSPPAAEMNGINSPCNSVPIGEWTHVAFVVGPEVRIYINGFSSDVVSDPESAFAVVGPMRFGNPPGSATPFRGVIDEIKHFRSARSAESVCRDAGGTYSELVCTIGPP